MTTAGVTELLFPRPSLEVDKFDNSVLSASKIFWRDNQPWLKESGFELRPRYRPDWIASWKGTTRNFQDCEDALESNVRNSLSPIETHSTFWKNATILDATRLSDGRFVMLKKVKPSMRNQEAGIGRGFSNEPLSADPHNHCVPVYDVLQVPDHRDTYIIVMPLLFNAYTPPFNTVGEVISFFTQILEVT